MVGSLPSCPYIDDAIEKSITKKQCDWEDEVSIYVTMNASDCLCCSCSRPCMPARSHCTCTAGRDKQIEEEEGTSNRSKYQPDERKNNLKSSFQNGRDPFVDMRVRKQRVRHGHRCPTNNPAEKSVY